MKRVGGSHHISRQGVHAVRNHTMRTMKVMALFLTAAIGGLLSYLFFIEPVIWYQTTLQKSVKILKTAQAQNDLTNVVGDLGLFIPLTNNAWIAIRYSDKHGGTIRSCAVAGDSGGGWFESDRHFCGSLAHWPRLKERVEAEEEERQLKPDVFANRVSAVDSDNGMFPSYRDMNAIESAPDLESARRALKAIGFKPLGE